MFGFMGFFANFFLGVLLMSWRLFREKNRMCWGLKLGRRVRGVSFFN